MMTFAKVSAVNVNRCQRWHKNGLLDWSVSDWAVAMAGEAGEVCNAVKKLRRVEDQIPSITALERTIASRKEAIDKIGEEIADTFLYLDLLAARLELSIEDEVKRKFNKTSIACGFTDRL